MIKEKSRDIPISELYSILQIEYLGYFLRSKIYKIYRKDFSDNYKRIADQKKEKIEKISIRNNLPSIFTDKAIREKYLKAFLNESGLPNFTYKDDEVKDKMSKWDRNYYFFKGTSVSFKKDGKVMWGIVSHNNKNKCIVSVEDSDGNNHELHYDNIKRIFTSDYFDF